MLLPSLSVLTLDTVVQDGLIMIFSQNDATKSLRYAVEKDVNVLVGRIFSSSNPSYRVYYGSVTNEIIYSASGSILNSSSILDSGWFNDIYYGYNYQYASSDVWNEAIPIYDSFDSFKVDVLKYTPITYHIAYRLTNCTAPSAPTEAAVGDTVNVPLVMQQGYDIVTPSTDIVVTNNGVVVPHTYSNGNISFTMPDPS